MEVVKEKRKSKGSKMTNAGEVAKEKSKMKKTAVKIPAVIPDEMMKAFVSMTRKQRRRHTIKFRRKDVVERFQSADKDLQNQKLASIEKKINNLKDKSDITKSGKRALKKLTLLQNALLKKPEHKDEAKKAGDVARKKTQRYVLFVGNLPYTMQEPQIRKHFETSLNASLTDVRMMLQKVTNEFKGAAFLEFPNKNTYEKALKLNGSFVEGRRIKVQYTGNNKKKAEQEPGAENKKSSGVSAIIKKKNLKLQAMMKKDKLGVGVNKAKRRADRRKRKAEAATEDKSA